MDPKSLAIWRQNCVFELGDGCVSLWPCDLAAESSKLMFYVKNEWYEDRVHRVINYWNTIKYTIETIGKMEETDGEVGHKENPREDQVAAFGRYPVCRSPFWGQDSSALQRGETKQ